MYIPLYRMVSKLSPTRLGSRKVFLDVSQVPSPTVIVSEEYELLPAGVSCGDGDMVNDSSPARCTGVLLLDGDDQISCLKDRPMRQLV